MSRAAATAAKNKGAATEEPAAPQTLPVAQIQVIVSVINEFGSPVPLPGGPFSFVNTAEGTAAQHMVTWAAQSFLNIPDEAPAD